MKRAGGQWTTLNEGEIAESKGNDAIEASIAGGKVTIKVNGAEAGTWEVDGALGLNAAHEIASGLETAVREELGPDVEVETHIEPLQTDGLAGRDSATERVAQVRDELNSLAGQIGFVGEVHDVRVRETAEGEIVNFHCRVDPGLTVRDVHEKVDEVERGLRRRWPSIKRVIGHAEPRQ